MKIQIREIKFCPIVKINFHLVGSPIIAGLLWCFPYQLIVKCDEPFYAVLYFPDLDFHIGKELNATHYPFAKRNKAIAEELDKKIENGESREEALQALKYSYEIDETSINLLLNKPINEKDLELFYTSVENPIYDYLNQKKEGSWEALDGDSLMDQAYAMGSHLKIWVWGKQSR